MSKLIKDFGNAFDVSACLTPLIRTADANSASLDLQQYRNAFFLNYIGITGDTLSGSIKLELEVQESDDDSTWAACADADVRTTVTGTNTGTVAVIDDNAEDDVVVLAEYTGTKRYVRMVHNFTGTHTNGIETAVIGLRASDRNLPA